ncbi:hypothetical protein [Halobacteriovorax sp.]|uniref:hypothetical protein n=1 Tax=Halobacteriovorax sp. TaxID=2020862 RepID=UPI003568A661
MKRNNVITIQVNKILSVGLMLSHFLFFNSNALAMTKEQCSLEYQAKVNELLNDKEKSARLLSEKVLGESFQKLAYAHHLIADSSPEEQKEYEKNLDKYISENYKYSMSASDVMNHLREFSSPFKNAVNKRHSSASGAKNTTKEKLQALVLFSRGLEDKKYHIEDYEKDALSKFNFKTHGREVDGWGLFVGDIARNFYQRRFYDDKDNHDDIDKRFSDKKISTYDSDVKDAIKAVKEDILEMAKSMNKECHAFLREVGVNSGMCSLSDPFDSPTKDLILDAETILSKINNPDATFIERPVSVHYAGAQFDIQNCKITESEAKPGTYKVEMKMNFKYIPGADSEDWSMSLFGGGDGHTMDIINDRKSSEDFKSNKTLQTFSEQVTFDQVDMPNGNPKGPLEFQFNNKAGGQVKMFTIGNNNYERDLNGDGSKYLINCAPDELSAEKPAEKEVYELKSSNENNNITLTLIKGDSPADFSGPELADSTVEWTLPEGIQCEENPDNKHNLACKITSKIESPTKVSYELINHSINPEKAVPPSKGEIDLTVTNPTPVEIKITKENDLESHTTRLTAVVTGDDTNPEVTWTINYKDEENKVDSKTGATIEVGLFDQISYKAVAAGKEVTGENSNKLTISVTYDGENSSRKEEVKLKASIKEKEFKDLKGSYSWECDGEACGSGTDKLTTKRKDKEFPVIVKFKTEKRLFTSGPVKLAKLRKDKDKKKDDEECEEEEDDDSDPFSTKVKKGCKPKAEETIRFAPKYMPPMQQPVILPPSQPYITPGFN